MTGIIFLTEVTYWNFVRCNCLRNKKYFLNFFFFFFFLQFENLDSILKILKKTMTLTADVFLNFWTQKDLVR